MKSRLAKKIVKASPLYLRYCIAFNKKPYFNRYWHRKWERAYSRQILSMWTVRVDSRLSVAVRKADAYGRSIRDKIQSRRALI